MFARIRDRVAKLEEQILPKRRVFVFFRVEEPDLPPYAEQLAAFKAEKGVGPHDILAGVVLTFILAGVVLTFILAGVVLTFA